MRADRRLVTLDELTERRAVVTAAVPSGQRVASGGDPRAEGPSGSAVPCAMRPVTSSIRLDEREDADPAELVVRRLHRSIVRVGEARHRTGHVAEQHEFGPGRAASAQHRTHRHPARGQRAAQRAAAGRCGRGRRGAGVPRDAWRVCGPTGGPCAAVRPAAPCPRTGTGIAVGRLHRHPAGDLVRCRAAPRPCRRASFAHLLAELLDAAPDLIGLDAVGERPRLPAAGPMPAMIPASSALRAQPVQGLLRRPAVRVVAAEGVDGLGGQPGQRAARSFAASALGQPLAKTVPVRGPDGPSGAPTLRGKYSSKTGSKTARCPWSCRERGRPGPRAGAPGCRGRAPPRPARRPRSARADPHPVRAGP